MKAINKQFLFTVLAGVTTLAVWELVLKPKVLKPEIPEQSAGFDFWPFD